MSVPLQSDILARTCTEVIDRARTFYTSALANEINGLGISRFFALGAE
jgi:hypothetical protein